MKWCLLSEAFPLCHGSPFPSVLLSHLLYLVVSMNYFIVYVEQLCLELPVVMNMVYTHTIQYKSHWLKVAIGHLKCGPCNQQTEFLILLNVS